MNKIGNDGDEEVLSSDHQEKLTDLEKVFKRLMTVMNIDEIMNIIGGIVNDIDRKAW